MLRATIATLCDSCPTMHGYAAALLGIITPDTFSSPSNLVTCVVRAQRCVDIAALIGVVDACGLTRLVSVESSFECLQHERFPTCLQRLHCVITKQFLATGCR